MSKHQVGFATAGSLMSILFFMIVNYLTSPNYMWFIYPAFLLLLWPLSLFLIKNRKYKLYSFFCSLIFIGFLMATNYLHSPSHPWFLYAAFPVIWWSISQFVGKRAKTVAFALIASISTILYYSILNFSYSPEYPWAIYPAYAILWWPISLYYVRNKNYFGLSVSASLLSIIFFSTVNVVSSPNTLWAVYPIFLILWWPLSMYYFQFLKQKQQGVNKG
jgi:hypothetical protein